MIRALKQNWPLLAVLVGTLLIFSAMPGTAFAETITTHDADEIRAALQSDGDVDIVLDGDVSKKYDRLNAGETVWCRLGAGSKTIDLAGNQFEISVENHGFHYEWKTLLDGSSTAPFNMADSLYLFDIAYGTSLTVDDSSGNNDGSIMFDGYMHSASNGPAGTHSGSYFNTSVLYRNVFNVSGGDLVFNGGSIDTRSKEQYLSPGRVIDSLMGGRIDEDVRQQVNCVGITMNSGNTIINGGVIRGRGYRYMFTCTIDYGAWGLNEYTRAAAIWATGGTVLVNDGEFEGKGGANVFDVSGAASVTVRAGSFTTHKLEKVLVPYYSDGEGSGTGAPRYMNGSYGTVGLDGAFLDADAVDVYVSDNMISESEWDADHLDNTHDVDIVPKKNGSLSLVDGRNAKVIEGREIVWDGTSSCNIEVPVDMTFDGYPWINNYWVAVAESTKSNPEGTSPTIYMGGQKISAPEAAPIEKTVGYNASYPEVQTIIDNGGTGSLYFNLLDLKPDGIAEGESFIVDFIVCQNLQPYNTGGYTQYLNRTRTLVVNIEPTNPAVEFGPEGYYGDDSTVTLRASADNATEAWWVQEWPEYKVLDGTFDTGSGMAELTVDVTNSAHYYRCFFRNEYGMVKTDVACVRKPLNYDIEGTDTAVTFYEGSGGGDLVVTGDLMSAFMSVGPEDREVHWYRLAGSERTPINYETGNYIIPSTPHYHFDTPSSSDAGQYIATVRIRLNGEWVSYDTGTYTVTVLPGTDPAVIESIELYGLGHPYLGDPVPDAITSTDERFTIESVSWSGASGGTLNVPTANVSMVLHANDGYSFAAGGNNLPITIDGIPVGFTSMTSIPNTQCAVSYTFSTPGHIELVPRTGLDEIGFALEPGSDVNIELTSGQQFTDFGSIEIDESILANTFSASSLPSWLELGEDGVLTGTVPEDAASELFRSAVTYRTDNTGSKDIASGITFLVTKSTNYLSLSDETLRWHEHEWGTWTDNGDGTHSRTCSTCGGKETHEHEWDEGETIAEATEGADGTIRYTCAQCGAVLETSDPYELHQPIVKVEEVPATCTTDGVKAHYVCEECGLMFWDADANEPIIDDERIGEFDMEEPDVTDAAAYAAWYEEYQARVSELVDENAQTAEDKLRIPALGHDWGEWTTITAPTADKPGLQQRVCHSDSSHVEERACFLISYVLNGGTLDGKTGIVEIVAGEGEVITLPAPTRSGYVFRYWQGSTYYAGDKYTVEGNHTFTAQWAEGMLANTGDVTPIAAIVVVMCVSLTILVLARRRLR